MNDQTIQAAAKDYIDYLREQGKKERTLYTYSKDFEVIVGYFGADKKMSTIRSAQVGKFIKSDALLKKPSGDPRAKPTIDKTTRVMRMFFVWARLTGRLAELPLPKDMAMGRSKTDAGDDATEADNADQQ